MLLQPSLPQQQQQQQMMLQQQQLQQQQQNPNQSSQIPVIPVIEIVHPPKTESIMNDNDSVKGNISPILSPKFSVFYILLLLFRENQVMELQILNYSCY